jgi:hypothetical protein
MANARITQDRDGHPWKAYSNGRLLCAVSQPLHEAYGPDNKETDGPCDCVNRTGETIATYSLTSRGLKKTS